MLYEVITRYGARGDPGTGRRPHPGPGGGAGSGGRHAPDAGAAGAGARAFGQLETQATQKYTHFDSEIAKLWTIAYQRNKPQLEEQKKLLEAQSAELEGVKQQLATASKQLDGLGGEVKQVATLKLV